MILVLHDDLATQVMMEGTPAARAAEAAYLLFETLEAVPSRQLRLRLWSHLQHVLSDWLEEAQ